MEPGDGPRHLVFHPDRNLAFVINELSNTVISLKHDPNGGMFEAIARVSTLPESFDGESYCADIHVSPDGQFLYASNRGHNSIAIFSISEDGQLQLLGTESTRGNWPRNFTLSPDGKYLIVANQFSGNVVVFERNPETGMLTYMDQQIEISSPVCLKFM